MRNHASRLVVVVKEYRGSKGIAPLIIIFMLDSGDGSIMCVHEDDTEKGRGLRRVHLPTNSLLLI